MISFELLQLKGLNIVRVNEHQPRTEKTERHSHGKVSTAIQNDPKRATTGHGQANHY